MKDVILNLDKNNRGTFYIQEDEERMAEMEISVSGNNLTVHHTEVFLEGEGKGLAKKLLRAMVSYARKKNLKVIALCLFVAAQFKRHPEEYAGVLNNQNN